MEKIQFSNEQKRMFVRPHLQSTPRPYLAVEVMAPAHVDTLLWGWCVPARLEE